MHTVLVCIGNAEVNEVNGQPGLFGISSSISMQRSEWIHRSEGELVDCILSYHHVFLFKFFSFDVKLFQGQKNSRVGTRNQLLEKTRSFKIREMVMNDDRFNVFCQLPTIVGFPKKTFAHSRFGP